MHTQICVVISVYDQLATYWRCHMCDEKRVNVEFSHMFRIFFAFEKSTDAGCFLRLRRASEVDAIGQMPVPVRMAWQWPLQWSWIRPQPEVNDGWLVIARQ